MIRPRRSPMIPPRRFPDDPTEEEVRRMSDEDAAD
jgi:hypothetical protein